jgi:HTH-type transcriptional regulator, cell division transcriptional repressor
MNSLGMTGLTRLRTARGLSGSCGLHYDPAEEAFALSAGTEPALWFEPMKKNAVGPRIKALRERLGLSEAELAERLCVSGWQVNASVVSKIESQERSVDDTEVLLLADVLGVDLNDVFVGAKMRDDTV